MAKVGKILLIDDDKDDQLIFGLAIRSIDPSSDFQTANHGVDGLRKLLEPAEKKPDIIFLDLNMPVMDGFECLQVIKHEDRLKDIPLYIFSTSSNQKDTARAKELKASGYFRKPNDLDDLVEKLRTIFAIGYTSDFRAFTIY